MEIETAGQRIFPIETAAKLGSFILVFTYAVGFIVVSLHLSSYGLSPLSSVSLQYLIAGCWALLPLALVMAAFFAPQAASAICYTNEVPNLRRILAAGWVRDLLGAGVLGLVWLVATLLGLRQAFWSRYGLSYVAATIVIYGLYILGEKLSRKATDKSNPPGVRFDNAAAVVFVVGIALLLVLLSVGIFAKHIYKQIPYALGGGKPVTVQFVIPTGKADLPVQAGSNGFSITYRLVRATAETYAVEPIQRGQRAIEFQRDIVNGIIVVQD